MKKTTEDTMMLCAKVLSYFPLAYCIFLCYNNKDGIFMDWVEIVTIVAGIAVPITLAIISERRSIKHLTKHLGFSEDEESMKRQLERKLGVSDKSVASQLGVSDQSITAQLGVSDKSISDQLGVSDKSIAAQLGVGNDDKSLTKQHEQLKSELMAQLSGISSFLSAKDEKTKKSLKRLKENQADIAQRLSDMSTVFEGYIQLLNTVEEQSRTIEQLRADNAALRQQAAELQERNSDRQDYDLEM